jgi:hypothetical protein
MPDTTSCALCYSHCEWQVVLPITGKLAGIWAVHDVSFADDTTSRGLISLFQVSVPIVNGYPFKRENSGSSLRLQKH